MGADPCLTRVMRVCGWRDGRRRETDALEIVVRVENHRLRTERGEEEAAADRLREKLSRAEVRDGGALSAAFGGYAVVLAMISLLVMIILWQDKQE